MGKKKTAEQKEKKQGKPYFVYAHNLWEWKAPDTFIKEIVAKTPNVDFKIIASDKTGNFIEKIRKMAPGYKNLELLLGLDRENFLKTLYCSSGVVSTSKIEGAQPNILLESGYLGVPYLSLAPGQNYGHYPHVEMLQGLEEMRSRLLEVVNDVYNIKKESLERAQKYFQSDKWHWNNVIKEYIKLFKE
jgi:glycosyltransferase involved in cell wall biosynthesis